ncbi:MAG: hypothetical protein EVA43_05860 [Flavobacteriales bacterium]|nr:MAG: hypothetical protein EVA43_05860 [Flavobacteriales bacterium]
MFFFIITNLKAQTIVSEIELPGSVYETSGLEKVDNNLITLNDSGNQPVLYYLNESGKLIIERNFSELQNNDWEDLAVDDEFIYIADIGNNFDTRDNLRIIKAPLDSADNSFEIINFYYPEQEDFSFKQLSMYDAEGLISISDYLLIFTKNRAKKITEIYKLPKKEGNYKAELIGEINIESIVTAADYNKKLRLLVLTSTKDFNEYYIHKIKKFNISRLKNLKVETYEIPIGKTQVEAIKIIDNDNFWITSEAEFMGSPLLYKISL